jgi:hypothetical protein
MPGRRNARRGEQQRAAIADEAARLMLEHGLPDYRAAKARALERLGLGNNAPLPGNDEIEAALAARQRIFRGDTQDGLIKRLRREALEVMSGLEAFQPRLVGSVLSGSATDHSSIDLHLFADAPETVAARLDVLGYGYKSIQLRHRWRRGESEQLPGYRVFAGNNECLISVFPTRKRGHAPLSPVDGKPMKRAGSRDVAALLNDAGAQ